MENCFVTDLMVEFQNDNLRELGEAQIVVPQVETPDYGANGNRRFQITSSSAQTIKCLGSGAFVNSSGTPVETTRALSANSMATVIVSNNNFNVSIPNKYALTYLKLWTTLGINIDELSISSGLTYLQAQGEKTIGNLSSLKGLTSLTSLDIAGSGVVGDIENLPSNVTGAYLSGTKVYGNINSIAKNIALTTLVVIDCHDIVGDLDTFAALMYAKGRTSGTLSCNFIRSGVTYNDQPLKGVKIITFSAGGYVIS